jgi:phosphoadenosine phosphosulfate reductase
MNTPRIVHADRASPPQLLIQPEEDLSTLGDLSSVHTTDGRAYSQAAVLRQSLGFTGRIQATGDVLVDQAQFMLRAGFDELVLREDQSIALAHDLLQLPALRYQSSVNDLELQTPKLERLTLKSADFAQKLDASKALLTEALALGEVSFACSLGAEDMVLLHLLSLQNVPTLKVFVLDTERLHTQTLELLQVAQTRFASLHFDVYKPEAKAVQWYESTHGRDAIYENVDLRKACCSIRKTQPLKRALAGKAAWITGLRSAQSATRALVAPREWDATHSLHKFSPLVDWTEGDVWHYIDTQGLPYNPLHDEHFPSIGCAPCTRAIAVGEDIRAGRWWWEDAALRECGLHVSEKVSTV